MQLYTIDTGYFKLDGGSYVWCCSKSVMESNKSPLMKIIYVLGNMRSLLIEDGDKLILIDNGIGDKTRR